MNASEYIERQDYLISLEKFSKIKLPIQNVLPPTITCSYIMVMSLTKKRTIWEYTILVEINEYDRAFLTGIFFPILL